MVESSIVIIGDEIVDYSKGSPCQVVFNWERIWDAYKARDKEYLPWFIHVHPRNCKSYSLRDLDCMQGFRCALGDSVYFSIIIFTEDDIDNLTHIQIDYIYDKDKETGEEFLEELDPLTQQYLGMPSLGQLALLKALSYGG